MSPRPLPRPPQPRRLTAQRHDPEPVTLELVQGPGRHREQAIRIARREVGGGRVTDVDLDDDDGVEVWEIEIERGRYEHDLTITVDGGEIIEHDRDRDDD